MCLHLRAGDYAGVWLTAGVFVLQSACVTTAPPALTREASASLGVVAIVPARYPPSSNFVAFAKSKPAGAAKGAAIGGGAGALSAGVAGAVTGTAAPYVLLIGIVATAVGASVGAAKGAREGVPAERTKEIESVINGAVAKLDAQRAFAREVIAITKREARADVRSVGAPGPANPNEFPAYAALAAAGIGTVMEIAVTKIGFEVCGPEYLGNILPPDCPGSSKNPTVRLFVSAQLRLVRVGDGVEVHKRAFRFTTPYRDIARWAANDARLLGAELERAYGELAERVSDAAWLVAANDLPAASGSWQLPGAPDYGVCWLAPVYPKVEAVLLSEAFMSPIKRPKDVCAPSAMHFGSVDSLQPTLRWSAFPRDLDRDRLDPAVLNRIRAVTYDLRIWDVERCERGAIVYERTGLTSPSHRLETALAPEHRYFWSVRARFTYDSQPTATPWAFFSTTNCHPNDIPNIFYHRFVTPR
jgi:DNA-binding transcriptional regulator YdaS (Cro superfamily)